RRLWRRNLVFSMGHLVMRLGRFEAGSRFRTVGLIHAGRRRYGLGLAVGGYGESSGLHLVRLFGVAIVPDCGNFRLLARRSACLCYLGLKIALLLDVSFDHLCGGASGVVSVLAF